jgi:predicted kinase
MAIALMTIGLPGSGKSFLARQFFALANGSVGHCDDPAQAGSWVYVSTDGVRAKLFGDEALQGPWPLIEQQLWLELLRAGQAQQSVWLDATHARRRQRLRALALLRAAGYGRPVGLWLDVPVSLCQLRNRQRDRSVPPEVIRRMNRYLKAAPPSLADGLEQIWQGQYCADGLGWLWRSRCPLPGAGLAIADGTMLPAVTTAALYRQLLG